MPSGLYKKIVALKNIFRCIYIIYIHTYIHTYIHLKVFISECMYLRGLKEDSVKMAGIKTIAEHCQCIPCVSENEVIYVYVSPCEIHKPSTYTFNLELTTHDTRFGAHLPQYFYGFCHDDGD